MSWLQDENLLANARFDLMPHDVAVDHSRVFVAMTPLRRTSQLYLINRGEALPVLMAAMACGTGRIYGGGTSGSMPIIFVHRRRGVPRDPPGGGAQALYPVLLLAII